MRRGSDRVIALLRQAGVIDNQKCIGCANDPARLQRKLGLKRNSIPKAIGSEMVKAVVLAWSEPFRHRLDPPFSRRRTLMNTDKGAVDHDDVTIEGLGNLAQNMIPDTCLAPSHEAIVAGCIRSISIRNVFPR